MTATISDSKSVIATLTTTTADKVQIIQFWDTIEISNLDTTNTLTVNLCPSGTYVAAAAGTEGQYVVPPGASKVFDGSTNWSGTPGSTTDATVCHLISVVGSGGTYAVEGHRGF